MFRREGRLSHPEIDAGTHEHDDRRHTASRHWERWIVVVVAVVLMMYGAVHGLNWVVSLFP